MYVLENSFVFSSSPSNFFLRLPLFCLASLVVRLHVRTCIHQPLHVYLSTRLLVRLPVSSSPRSAFLPPLSDSILETLNRENKLIFGLWTVLLPASMA